MIGKENLISLNRFHSANKMDNYSKVGEVGKIREKEKKSRSNSRASQNMRIITVFLEPLLSAFFPSLWVTVHVASRGCSLLRGWSLDLLWGQLRLWSGPPPLCSCLQCPQLSELVHFLLWQLSMAFDIFHRDRVCLVDRVHLICSLYSWWEGFGSSSLATLPLGFSCGFISTSACGSFTGVCSWGCPGGLGFAPVRARSGGGAAAWVAGNLTVPGIQGSWWLGQQEI